ncbi:MAG: LemA family protein, partial [Oscillospiraceae bacterium]
MSQRKLVSLDELCGNSLSQIGVQQNSRWDALTALVDLTKQYSEHEHKTLMDVIGSRRTIDAHSTAQDAEEQENILTQAMGRLMAIAEAYPDLKANTMYKETMDGVKQYEENVRHSRMVYNDTVTKFNRTVRQIPVCFIARPMGFSIREYLKTEDSKTQMPKM